MSGLWTPSGPHEPDPEQPHGAEHGAGQGGGPAGGGSEHLDPADEAALQEELARVRAEIAGTPAVDIVANHAIGLWNLAVLHLTAEEGQAPRLAEASIAIDAMGGMVDALGDRLGEHAAPLRDAVTQLRLAFVEVQRQGGAGE